MKLYAAAGLPEEELLKRCGGRTAHKGARHGLKASAKLERIERQEGSAKLSGASTPVTAPSSPKPASPPLDAVLSSIVPASSPPTMAPIIGKVKKSKKRQPEPESSVPFDAPLEKKRKKTKKSEDVHSLSTESETPKKKKKKKEREEQTGDALLFIQNNAPAAIPSLVENLTNSGTVKEKKRKKKKLETENSVALTEAPIVSSVTQEPIELPVAALQDGSERKKSKKKKKKDVSEASTISVSDDPVTVSVEAVDVKKKKKKKPKIESVSTAIPNFEEVVVEKKEKKKKKKKSSD